VGTPLAVIRSRIALRSAALLDPVRTQMERYEQRAVVADQAHNIKRAERYHRLANVLAEYINAVAEATEDATEQLCAFEETKPA
jgi:hypothetical protein